jgi:uncharacterized protein with HEPN domain
MHPKSAKLVEDIRDAAAFILEASKDMSSEQFSHNRLVRQAVERNFQIIGEAARRLTKADEVTAAGLGPVARVIAFRNIIVHGYDSMDYEVVWSVIKHDLPSLSQKATELLRSAGLPNG